MSMIMKLARPTHDVEAVELLAPLLIKVGILVVAVSPRRVDPRPPNSHRQMSEYVAFFARKTWRLHSEQSLKHPVSPKLGARDLRWPFFLLLRHPLDKLAVRQLASLVKPKLFGLKSCPLNRLSWHRPNTRSRHAGSKALESHRIGRRGVHVGPETGVVLS